MEEYDEEMLEYCYECNGLGDDYYLDDDGELACACPECMFNPYLDDGELICAFSECMFNPYRNDED